MRSHPAGDKAEVTQKHDFFFFFLIPGDGVAKRIYLEGVNLRVKYLSENCSFLSSWGRGRREQVLRTQVKQAPYLSLLSSLATVNSCVGCSGLLLLPDSGCSADSGPLNLVQALTGGLGDD